ncbi:hypothetical protein F4819DRAFT_491791 [Hypoxylon fuscum]|nr:hypothetical protein F4819DRAFT_491791 [Hypoxylon fuscum]
MYPPLLASRFSSKAFLTLGLSVFSLVSRSNAWVLEFWSSQADCNYKIRDNGGKIGADTSRSNPDHMSNNCMSMPYDPDTDGIITMKVTDWTDDCAIALWSDKAGSVPCQAEIPFGVDSDSQRPDYVFTTKSTEAVMATDEDGSKYACISPLNEYVRSNSGFLGYVAYSCGGNGTFLLDEYRKSYDGDQLESLIKSLAATTATTTTRMANTRTHESATATGDKVTTHKLDNIGTGMAKNSSAVFTPARFRVGVPPRPTTLFKRRALN